MQSKECSPGTKEELRGALYSMLQSVVGKAEEVSHVTQTPRHALDRGDWTQPKTPIVVRRAECASDAGTQRGAGGAPVCDLSKRLTGRALAPPVFAKVQSRRRGRPDSPTDKTTLTSELDFSVMTEKQPVAARVGRSIMAGVGSPRGPCGPAHWLTGKTTTSYTLDFDRTANHEQTTTADCKLLMMLAVSRLLACSQVSTVTVHKHVAHTRSGVRARYFTVTANKRYLTQYKCRDVSSPSKP